MRYRAMKAVVVMLGVLLMAVPVGARHKVADYTVGPWAKSMARPEVEYKVHKLGNLWDCVTNFGAYGDENFEDSGRPSMEWPAGSDSDYLYLGSLWVGTIIEGQKSVSCYFYGTTPYSKEWVPSEGSLFDLGPGQRSIEDSYTIYDDYDPNTPSHTALNLKVYQRGLTWSMPDYDDFIAYEYAIVNKGEVDLNDVYVGWWYDLDVCSQDNTEAHIDDLVDFDGYDGDDTNTDRMDIVDPLDLDNDGETGYDEYGLPWANEEKNPNADPSKEEPDGVPDEYTIYEDPEGPVLTAQVGENVGKPLIRNATGDTLRGYIVPRNMSYIYDSDHESTADIDIGERKLSNPCLGYVGGRLLYTPLAEEDSTMNRPYSHQWWNWESDPGTDDEQYDYMLGRHEASIGFHFLPNPKEIGAPVFDYRFLQTTGPFDLAVNDTLKIVWVEAVGLGLEGLRRNMDNALVAYYKGSRNSNPLRPSAWDEDAHWVLPTPPTVPVLEYSPGDMRVNLAWDNTAETTPDLMYGVIDFRGYKVYRARYTPQEWELIYACDNIDSLMTIYTTDGDSVGVADLPDVVNTFTDSGGHTLWGTVVESPINGLPYYYSVVAYDKGFEATADRPELEPQESAKSNYKTDPTTGAPVPVYPRKMYEAGDAVPSLSNVSVVPNPYKGTALWEPRYEDRIRFSNLPPACKITIYTLAGDKVQTIMHDDGTDAELWDLVSRNDQSVVSGIYLYVVEAEVGGSVEKKIGKFVIIR